jgi:hypothetical protein
MQIMKRRKGTSFIRLFSGLSRKEKLILVSGTLSAIIAGVMLPCLSLFMGNIAVAFSGSVQKRSLDDLRGNITAIARAVIAVAVALFVFSYLFFALW